TSPYVLEARERDAEDQEPGRGRDDRLERAGDPGLGGGQLPKTVDEQREGEQGPRHDHEEDQPCEERRARERCGPVVLYQGPGADRGRDEPSEKEPPRRHPLRALGLDEPTGGEGIVRPRDRREKTERETQRRDEDGEPVGRDGPDQQHRPGRREREQGGPPGRPSDRSGRQL